MVANIKQLRQAEEGQKAKAVDVEKQLSAVAKELDQLRAQQHEREKLARELEQQRQQAEHVIKDIADTQVCAPQKMTERQSCAECQLTLSVCARFSSTESHRDSGERQNPSDGQQGL